MPQSPLIGRPVPLAQHAQNVAASGVTVEDVADNFGGVTDLETILTLIASGSLTTWKLPVRVATTTAGTLSSSFEAGDTVDGVVLAEFDRILIKDQAAGAENGIYVVAAAGTPTRAGDMDEADEVVGAVVYVIAGTSNAQSIWINTNLTEPTIETTALTFAEFNASTGALTVINGGGGTVKDHGSMGATETIDLADGNFHHGILDTSCTLTFSVIAGVAERWFTLEVTQDGTGGWTITWPGSVSWVSGAAPTQDTTAGTTSVYHFITRNAGSTWLGGKLGGGAALTIEDEGTPLATAAETLDFVGAGVTASGTGIEKTISIPGTPTGAAGGDLAGTYPNPTVVDDSHSHTSTSLPTHFEPVQFDDGSAEWPFVYFNGEIVMAEVPN